MPITVGQKAPDFQLPDQHKNMVSLESYRGKNVVLLFFPAAFTSTCTKEMCQTRDELSFYNDMNAQVLGISADLPFSLIKYGHEHNLTFPLLSDFNKEAMTAYDCKYDNWHMGLKGVAKRASFVIDKEGIIRFAQVLESASDYPDFDGIKKTLEELK